MYDVIPLIRQNILQMRIDVNASKIEIPAKSVHPAINDWALASALSALL
jgi:hypothetical protein